MKRGASGLAAVVLLAILVLGAYLRFDRLGGPSYWLDEILGDELTTQAAEGPWWHWLTGIEREHGPLYYATQLAARAFGRDEAAGRLPAALFGLATIAVVALARRRPAGWPGGVSPPAALLLAASPLHVYYSREARPYALLMLLTAALLVAVLRGRTRIAIVLMVAMLYTTAVAGPLLVAVALTLAAARRWTLAGAAGVSAALVPLLYRGPSNAAAAFDANVASSIVHALTVSALGKDGSTVVIALLIAFAVLGGVMLWRRDRDAAIVVVGFTVLPIVCGVGALAAIHHWFAVRYVSPAVIGFVVLVGEGVTFGGGTPPGQPAGRRRALGLAIALGFAVLTVPAARREAFEKLDWRAIGATLERHLKPRDYVVAADEWSGVCIRHYLRHLPPGARIAGVTDPLIAEMLTYDAPVWFVSVGFTRDTRVRDFVCRYPLLMASRFEDFRLHYARSPQHYLRENATAEDLRAVAAALGAHVLLRSGKDDEILRGDGWAEGEGGFRWAIAKEASIVLPRLAPTARRVTVTALPFAHPSLPPQTIRLSINGAPVGAAQMTGAWRDYAFDAPAAVWREGLNALTFSFDRVNVPADFGAVDRRPLAAAFERIAIDDAGDSSHSLPPLFNLRFASDALVVARTAPRSARTRFPQLNPAAAQQILGRLGFDPRLARGDLHLEDFAAALAYESGCEDDRAFLDRAFAVLAGRNPNPGEQADLLGRLRRKTPRAAVVERILRAQDVQSNLTQHP